VEKTRSINYTLEDFLQFSSERRDKICRYKVASQKITCPVCRVRGPFRRDQKTDDAARQVSSFLAAR